MIWTPSKKFILSLAFLIAVSLGIGYLGGRLHGRAKCAVTLEQTKALMQKGKTYLDSLKEQVLLPKKEAH